MVILQSWTEVFTASMDQGRTVILKEEAESARVDVTATAWIESALVIQIWEDTHPGIVLLHVPDGEGGSDLHPNNTLSLFYTLYIILVINLIFNL